MENDSDYTPDIIMLNSGFNEAGNISSINIGDLDIVMTKTLDEIINSTDANFGKNMMYGSMRWILETLLINYPNATIIGVVPWQGSTNENSNIFFNMLKPVIEKLYARMGIPLIDCFSNGGIYSVFENQPPYKYTLDNIHVRLGNNVNEKGRAIQYKFIKKEFLNIYYSRI